MRLQQRARIVAHVDMRVECGGDAIGGDVVVGWPNPAGCENMSIAARQRLNCGHDCGRVIGHDAYFGQVDPCLGQLPRKVIHIRIPRPP